MNNGTAAEEEFSDIEGAEESKIPIRAMRDRLFKIYKDMVKYNKEVTSFHKTLQDRLRTSDGGQDSEVMKAAAVELEKAVKQLDAAYKWISFINDYGPISDG